MRGIHGFMGRGRLELARTLFGRLRPDGGMLRVAGRPAARLRNTAAAERAGVAYSGSALQNEFDDDLLDSVAAVVVVGGTSLFGGRGGIGNAVVGLFVPGVLNNGLDHIDIDGFLKILIRGLILLAAPSINVYAQRLRAAQQVG